MLMIDDMDTLKRWTEYQEHLKCQVHQEAINCQQFRQALITEYRPKLLALMDRLEDLYGLKGPRRPSPMLIEKE